MGFSFILPILVTLVGGYFLIRLRFFFILHPIRTAKRLFFALASRTSRRSLFLSLAGTLGVGNIFGVATGIIIGGEGSLLWLFFSSFFAAAIKYAEAAAACDRVGEGVGIASVIRRAYPRFSIGASRLYAALALLLSLVMGAAIQSGSVAAFSEHALSVPPILSAAILFVFVAAVVLGGGKRIADATEKIIPLTTVAYITVSLCAVIANAEALPTALFRVFNSAISPTAAAGGAVSFILSRALSEGYARGILSNEAGAGTSAMAHAGCGALPSDAGLFGICEVFFDTPLLCTLTGLVIVSSTESVEGYTSAMALVSDAFRNSLGAPAAVTALVSVLLFAYSTIICWHYYGRECLYYLVGCRGDLIYTLFFFAFIFVGALCDTLLAVALCDTVLLLMTVLTLPALLLSSRRIVSLSREAGLLGRGE